LPEGIRPQLQRLLEAVDVLGAAELLDPGLPRGIEVPLDVGLCEGALAGSAKVAVLAQVDVVVGEHGSARVFGGLPTTLPRCPRRWSTWPSCSAPSRPRPPSRPPSAPPT